MVLTIAVASAVVFVVAATYDVVAGAAVAGVFSVVNTVIGAFLVREHRRTRHIYDRDGNAVGVVRASPDRRHADAAGAPGHQQRRRADRPDVEQDQGHE